LSLLQLYFSFDGRIGRQTFWLKGVLLYSLILLIVAFAVGLIAGLAESPGLFLLLILPVYVLGFWPSLAVQVKRWHDRDRSGWWVLIGFIPVIGSIWTLIELGFLEGTAGANRFSTGDGVEQSISDGGRNCPQCDAENHWDNIYCTNCGTNLGLAPPVEYHVSTLARFVTPMVALIVGLIFASVLLYVTTRESAETLLEGRDLGPGGIAQLQRNIDERPSVILFWPFSSDLEATRYRGQPVKDIVLDRIPTTLLRMTMGLGLGILVSWGLAFAFGLQRHPPGITAGRMVVASLASMPLFWLGLLIVLAKLHLPDFLPNPDLSRFYMTSIVVGAIGGFWAALEIRSLGSTTATVLLARATGLVLRHGGMLLSGMVVLEIIFSAPGLGKLLFQSALNQDVPILGASAAVFIWLALFSRLAGNLVLAAVDSVRPARTEVPSGNESGTALAIVAAVTLGLLALLFLAPLMAPQDPLHADFRHILEGPGSANWLGTDLGA
jgi:uncharacterized membrane protein YhaH (DUF805 family)/ABC-type dipeptide/oligopeptide/nickel transport system permease component